MTSDKLRSILGATFLCALAVTACILLGRWQWTNAFLHEQVPSAVVVNQEQPLASLSAPEQWLPRTSIGALTSVTGTAVGGLAFRTEPRPTTTGQRAWWITPVRLSDDTVLAVATAARPSTTSARITVIGRLQPSEDSPAAGAWQPAQAQLATPRLVDRWPFPVVRDGYLVATQSQPNQPLPVARFTSAPSGSIGWRNIAYAFQWLAFALFAGFVWWRHVTDRQDQPIAV